MTRHKALHQTHLVIDNKRLSLMIDYYCVFADYMKYSLISRYLTGFRNVILFQKKENNMVPVIYWYTQGFLIRWF